MDVAVPPAGGLVLAVTRLGAAEIRDHAGLFSAEAVRKAQAELERSERASRIPVVIETVPAIPGLEGSASAAEKRHAIETLAEKKAKDIGYEGVYLLISKHDQVFSEPLVKERYASRLPRERRRAVRTRCSASSRTAISTPGSSRRPEYRGGALRGPVPAALASGPRRPGAAAGRPGKFGLGTLLVIGLGIFGVLLLLRVLGGLFNRGGGYPAQMGMGGMPRPGMGPGPGYGGPGYGYGAPRGGGFFSGMLGGLGGALAGNWLYDQFSGRHGRGPHRRHVLCPR